MNYYTNQNDMKINHIRYQSSV